MKRKIITIAVGSENPVKIEAVRLAFQVVWPKENFQVTGISMKSGVSDQPMSDRESIRGAQTRAKGVMTMLKTDFGVGLEGGLQKIGTVWFDCGWAVVIDRKGRLGIGSTLRIEVPSKIIKLIKSGLELGHANDQLFGLKNSKQAAGYFGAMTNGVITRAGGLRDSVVAALTRFVHPPLWM